MAGRQHEPVPRDPYLHSTSHARRYRTVGIGRIPAGWAKDYERQFIAQEWSFGVGRPRRSLAQPEGSQSFLGIIQDPATIFTIDGPKVDILKERPKFAR